MSDSLQSMEFSRPEDCSRQPFPSPGDLPNPGIETRSPALQAESLPAELPGKPKNTGVDSPSFLQGIFPTQGLNWGLCHCRQILYRLSHQKILHSTCYGMIADSSIHFSRSVMSASLWPMDHSMPSLPVHHQLLEFTQTHVQWVSNAILLSHALASPSSPAFNLSHHWGLF